MPHGEAPTLREISKFQEAGDTIHHLICCGYSLRFEGLNGLQVVSADYYLGCSVLHNHPQSVISIIKAAAHLQKTCSIIMSR